MPELDFISVSGFRSIANLNEVRLGNICVLIGPNGSGKSNFIDVFAFLHEIREGRLQNYVAKSGGAERILHFGSKSTELIRIHVSFSGGVNQYEIELSPTVDDSLYPSSELASFWRKSQYPSPYGKFLSPADGGKEAAISEPRDEGGIQGWIRARFDRWRLYHFHDTSANSPLKKAADLNDNRFLRPNGSNIAAFLYYLRLQHNQSYETIRHVVRRVAPFFEDFQLEPNKLNPNTIRLEWKHRNSSSYFDASALSDGTLRFIAIATLLMQPDRYKPSVILIDEPELGLHPFAIGLLTSMVQMASQKTQVILSTQSPILLDYFSPEDILVADRVAGGTTLNRLDSQELAEWLKTYSLGQLWEKNEIGGRPVQE